eukprot:gb/GFBE01050960.1/.p1 GENE.gb/GFBE01050960.1/~~gb/GFBE01050960.1/.p1  ORF type:complete len:210 (+),score=9.22 gb/GFBE01050960.1/:1-630(+)
MWLKGLRVARLMLSACLRNNGELESCRTVSRACPTYQGLDKTISSAFTASGHQLHGVVVAGWVTWEKGESWQCAVCMVDRCTRARSTWERGVPSNSSLFWHYVVVRRGSGTWSLAGLTRPAARRSMAQQMAQSDHIRCAMRHFRHRDVLSSCRRFGCSSWVNMHMSSSKHDGGISRCLCTGSLNYSLRRFGDELSQDSVPPSRNGLPFH